MTERRTAESLATEQRAISVSEFFVKNRHLLGFDSPARALLTAVKEAVDNSLDACEEAGWLPEIAVAVDDLGDDRYRVAIEDNGPGIVEEQVGRIFGKLLYGSKFHRLAQSRGQQGMGISAAGMYGQLTTGKPMRIVTRTDRDHAAREMLVAIDTRKNRPDITSASDVPWPREHGTRVEIELEGQYQHGAHSVALFLKLTATANPHVSLSLREPDGTTITWPAVSRQLPRQAERIKPHPHGLELGRLIAMLKASPHKHLREFLIGELAQVGPTRAKAIIDRVEGLTARSYSRRIARSKAAALHDAIAATPIPAPPTSCVVPIGREELLAGLRREVPAQFYTATSRRPSVYRGNPFVVEVGIAYGQADSATIEVDEDGHLVRHGRARPSATTTPARILRFANRVPLLYHQSHCAMTQAIASVSWRRYGLDQPADGLPLGPVAIFVHIASVWVPYTSESKDAIARYDDIDNELRLALQACGRELSKHLHTRRRLQRELDHRDAIERYLPHVADALAQLLDYDDDARAAMKDRLGDLVHTTRSMP